MRSVRSMALVVASLAVVLLTSPAASAATPKSRLLSLSDLPTGWSVTRRPSTGGGVLTTSCLSALRKPPKHGKKASATFTGDTTSLSETLATGPGTVARIQLLNRTLRTCRGGTLTDDGKTVHLDIDRMSIPKVARTSVAFSLTAEETGITVWSDLVTFRVDGYVGVLFYGGIGTPDATAFLAFAKEAVAKADGKHVAPPSTVAG